LRREYAVKKSFSILLTLLFLATTNCARRADVKEAGRVDLEAERASLRNLDSKLLKYVQEKDLKSFLSVYADDVYVFPPNAPLLTGREAGGKLWSDLFTNPGFDLSWQLTQVELSRAGDLAYESGTYRITTKDSRGKLITDRGKFVAVFRKQTNGEWKQVVDIWNSDQPPPMATTR